MAVSALMKCDIDLRNHLYKEIVLTGGNTQIKNFPQRLLNELSDMLPKDTSVRILA